MIVVVVCLFVCFSIEISSLEIFFWLDHKQIVSLILIILNQLIIYFLNLFVFLSKKNSRGQVKIADFGISKLMDNSAMMSMTAVGSSRYMSPERLLGQQYDRSSDIWAVGMMMIEIWLKRSVFSVFETPIALYGAISAANFEDDIVKKELFPKHLRALILSMTATDPEARADCTDIINSTWFNNFGLFNLETAHEVIFSAIYSTYIYIFE